jgi:hypothetical protein
MVQTCMKNARTGSKTTARAADGDCRKNNNLHQICAFKKMDSATYICHQSLPIMRALSHSQCSPP